MTRLATVPAMARAGIGVGLLVCAWLFLAAVPAVADGGPHVAANNSGTSTLTADGCAGCHRAHTAQGALLLAESEEEALCLSCHGASGLGATTDVESGVQYALGTTDVRDTAVLAGALRSGGFLDARIDSTNPSRISYPRLFFGAYVTWFSAEVPVLSSGQPTTSAHLRLAGASFPAAPGVAWGNGATNSGPGPDVSITCGSCHNPHGNGQYRILNPVPTADGSAFVPGPGAGVTDAALPTGSGAASVRNYTILWGRTLEDVLNATYPGGGVGPNEGDYWRRYLPWDGVPGWNGTSATPASGSFGDKPMYVPGGTNLTSFRAQITQWCSGCHTRYDQVTGATIDTGDDIYRYRHDVGQNECTQCHVGHGSNALMSGTFSSTFPYPHDPSAAATTSASSRLLKIDNRGTCQACHDPTHTVPFTNVINP
jgi:predicted CXXCH cytochrome family protein